MMGCTGTTESKKAGTHSSILVTVTVDGAAPFPFRIWIDEPALLWKLRLYQTPPDCTTIPPPTAAQFLFADRVIDDHQSARQHGLASGAVLVLRAESPITISVQFDSVKQWTEHVWKAETVGTMLLRLHLGGCWSVLTLGGGEVELHPGVLVSSCTDCTTSTNPSLN